MSTVINREWKIVVNIMDPSSWVQLGDPCEKPLCFPIFGLPEANHLWHAAWKKLSVEAVNLRHHQLVPPNKTKHSNVHVCYPKVRAAQIDPSAVENWSRTNPFAHQWDRAWLWGSPSLALDISPQRFASPLEAPKMEVLCKLKFILAEEYIVTVEYLLRLRAYTELDLRRVPPT